MQLTSHSLTNGAPIDREFAAGDANGFAPDRNPHLAWSGRRPAPVRSCWYAWTRTYRPCRIRLVAAT